MVQISLRDVLLIKAADYLCSPRGGGVYRVRVKLGVRFVQLCVFVSIYFFIAVRSIVQTIGLGGEKIEIFFNIIT